MPPSPRNLWARIAGRPPRKHLELELDAARQIIARQSEHIGSLVATKCALIEIVADARAREANETAKRRELIDMIVEKDLVEAVEL